MSTNLDEKLSQHRWGTPGRPKASAEAIRRMWGQVTEEGPNVLVRTSPLTGVERWVRVHGSGSSALFELETTREG